MATTLNALWPTITTKRAAVAAALISAATTLWVAFFFVLIEREAIAEYGTIALLFPALLMIIAWRTWRLSRVWSLFGAVLAGIVVTASLFAGPDLGGILVFFAMITGHRAARAWHRLSADERRIDAPADTGVSRTSGIV